jgi:hypothetical protein
VPTDGTVHSWTGRSARPLPQHDIDAVVTARSSRMTAGRMKGRAHASLIKSRRPKFGEARRRLLDGRKAEASPQGDSGAEPKTCTSRETLTGARSGMPRSSAPSPSARRTCQVAGPATSWRSIRTC